MTKTVGLSQKLNKFADNKALLAVLWLILVLLRLPFVNKGIDYTDTGFNLTNYMEVFGGLGINGIGTFLTNLIGGIAYEVLSSHQLLVFRVVYWLMCVATDVCAYLIFKEYVKPAVVLGALIAHSYFSLGGESLFSYYPLTKLILLISILLLIKGIYKKKCALVFVSGILCGVNTFVRLPNILFCIMIFGIIAYWVWTKNDRKTIVKQSINYFFGAVIGVIIVLICMIIYMGFDKVIESFMSYVNLLLGKSSVEIENFLGIEEVSGHSVMGIIKTLIVQTLKAVKDICIFGVPMLLIAFLCTIIGNRSSHIGRVICVCAFFVIEVAFVFVFRTQMRVNLMYVSALALVLLSLFMIFMLKGKNPEHRTIYLVVFLLALCSVFGSDLGLNRINILQGMIVLTMLMAVSDIIHYELLNLKHQKVGFVCKNVICFSVVLIIICELVTGVTVNTQSAFMDGKYSDMNSRTDKRITVLNGMKTTENRASQLNEYYEVMSKSQFADAQVAIFGYFPLGYVIGPQHDYFENVQPCVDYPAVSVVSLLSEIEKKKEEGIYPIIVLSHINKIQRGDDHDTSDAKLAVIDYMLTLTDYEVYLDDENFLIYVPSRLIQQ